MTAPMWSKMAALMWTEDGHQKMAGRGGQLGGTRAAGEGSWGDQACRRGQLRGDQASRGGKLEAINSLEEGIWGRTRPLGKGSCREGRGGNPGLQRRALGRETRPPREGSWGQPCLQERAIGGDQTSSGKQLGAIELAEEQLSAKQASRGMVRGMVIRVVGRSS
uniref:Uncharacterized protein n=1 Tax=Pipistrellus kuhlii TaxID=59472 RepID=A0A7J8B202_PIPKU|nr:hypothetical protein mPipKuh1_007914 [Pipistrellus kuhlii]